MTNTDTNTNEMQNAINAIKSALIGQVDENEIHLNVNVAKRVIEKLYRKSLPSMAHKMDYALNMILVNVEDSMQRVVAVMFFETLVKVAAETE